MFIIIIAWLVLAAVIGAMASNRGRSGFGWFLLAIVTSPILAALFLAAAGDLRSRGSPSAAPSRAPPPTMRRAEIIGDGAFRFPIVGESHYQGEIEVLAGGRTRGGSTGKRIEVVLMPEPENPYDPHAVAVKAGSTTIGYLARDVATLFNAALADGGYSSGACQAAIKGGWDRDGAEGSFGVFLNARLPFALRRADSPVATAPFRPLPDDAPAVAAPKTARAVPILATIAAVLAVCLVAAFVWTRWPQPPSSSVAAGAAPAPSSVSIVQPAVVAAPVMPAAPPKMLKSKVATRPKPASNTPMNLLPPTP